MNAMKLALSHMIGKKAPAKKIKKPKPKKSKRYIVKKKSKINLSSRALSGLRGLKGLV